MKKSQFIELVAERAEMSRAAAARVVDAIFDTASGAISEAVRTAGHLSIPGFGKFTSKTRAAREGRNPRTGMVIQIPERTTVTFAPGKGFRETMADGGSGPGRGAAKKSRTAGSARKAAGGATKTRSAAGGSGGGGNSGGGNTGERATAKKSATTKKSSGGASKSAAKKSGGGSGGGGSASKSASKSATKGGGAKKSGK